MEYNPKCLRKVANWSYLTKHHKFDKKTFDPENIKENLKTYSPKTQSLIEKIKELDEDDYKTHGKYFKHFIFSEVKDGGYGVRVITAALIAEGFKLGYDNKVNVLDDSELLKNKNDNILLLSSTKVFNTTINVKRKKAILAKYNQRPENSHGKLARIILLDSGFKEGIDLFDVKYVHIFEPQTSKADQKQAIGRATRLCGQKGIEFHPKYGWPLEVFLYDTTIPSDLMKYYDNDDSLFKFFLKYSGIDLRQIDFVDELEKYSIVGAVDYELTANVHRFALEEEETDISWLFPSKKGGLARKYITDEISCQKKCSARPTKDVPIGLPLFISIYFVYGKKLPDLRKESPRKFLCKVLKEDEDFCALARKAWKDPARFIKKNKAVFAEAIKEKKHLNLPRGTRPSFIKFVNSFGSIYSPSTASTVASHSVVSSKASSKALSASSKSSSSNSSSPVESSPSVISTASPKSISSTSIPLPETSKNIVESYESPKKIMNFIDMRKYIRENYIQYKWPKVKMENLCVPKGGSELVNFTPTQDFIRHFFTPESAYKGMLLFHSVGTGKCHAKDTPILMYDGTIKMVQDVKVGDKLMGDDSTPRKVLSLAQGQDEMYDIIPVKGDKYTVNQEHILVLKFSGRGTITNVKTQKNNPYKTTRFDKESLKMKTKSFKTKEEADNYLDSFTEEDRIIEIEVKDYLKMAKTLQRELKGFRKGVEFTKKDVEFDPYILGLWFGDGTSREPKITSQDAKILVYLRKELPKYNLILNYESKYDYRISSNGVTKENKFLKILQKYNLINNKHIPYIYKCNDRDTRLKLLAGLLDTDGSYSEKDKCFEISQKSEVLAKDILYLARSLGFAAYSKVKTVTWEYKGEKKTGHYNRIHISGDGLEDIPTQITRKKAIKRTQIKDALITGISVNHIGKGNYYGFTLDKNNRYLLGDFTVTHNTCSAIATATTSFEKENYTILWVTRTTLKSDVYKNMFDQVCHTILQQKLDKIPEKSSERLRLLSASWKIKPMSYKQFSNLVSGKNKLHKELIKINGEKDPLKNTLLIIDEAHKLYGGTDLSSKEKPDMEKLHESVMNSYKVSGKNSVRLLLMTATPITNDPMELIKILNLCRQKDDQLPVEYDKFADKFKVDENGKFSKKGSREYLDAIAGYISYLSRERDARQFSQPIITRVDSEISTPTINTKKIEEIETKYDGQIEDFKDQIFEINEELKQFKKETMAKKKEAKEDCKQYKKEEKKECLEKAKDLIEQYNDELSDKKDQVTDDVKNLKAEIKSLKKDKKEELKVYTEDKSQETAVQTKCIKKPKKEKKSQSQNGTSKSQSPPISGKSDTQPVVYSP